MKRSPEPLKPGFIGGTIKRNSKEQFLKGTNRRIGLFKIPESRLAEIKKLYYQEEQSLSKIAKNLNCPFETLRQFFLRHKLKPRTQVEDIRLMANGCGFGRAGIRKDLNQYFRSSWEANIARLFNYYEIPWQYKPQTFVLREISYTPDFLIKDDIYLEVKGKYLKNVEEKIKRFRKFYPDKKYILIDSKLYRQLERVYHRVIPNWEYR